MTRRTVADLLLPETCSSVLEMTRFRHFATALAVAGLLSVPALAHAEPAPVPPVQPVSADPAPPALSVASLAAANQIANPNLILVGQVIRIDGRPDYTVIAGDTLSRILGTPPPAVLAPPALDDPLLAIPERPEELIAPVVPVAKPTVLKTRVNWDAVAKCESGNNWAINTGNGYEGGVQFLNSTWRSVKAPGDPTHAYQASREQQIAAAERLLDRAGIGQWPICGAHG